MPDATWTNLTNTERRVKVKSSVLKALTGLAVPGSPLPRVCATLDQEACDSARGPCRDIQLPTLGEGRQRVKVGDFEPVNANTERFFLTFSVSDVLC